MNDSTFIDKRTAPFIGKPAAAGGTTQRVGRQRSAHVGALAGAADPRREMEHDVAPLFSEALNLDAESRKRLLRELKAVARLRMMDLVERSRRQRRRRR